MKKLTDYIDSEIRFNDLIIIDNQYRHLGADKARIRYFNNNQIKIVSI